MTAEPTPGERAGAALGRVIQALPAGEDRPGQVAMAAAVADAIHTESHLVVQAGTGVEDADLSAGPASCGWGAGWHRC